MRASHSHWRQQQHRPSASGSATSSEYGVDMSMAQQPVLPVSVHAAYERAHLVKVLSIAAFLGLMLFVLGVSERGPLQLPAIGLFIALTATFLLIAPLLMWRWAARHLHRSAVLALAHCAATPAEVGTQTSPHERHHNTVRSCRGRRLSSRHSVNEHIVIALPRRAHAPLCGVHIEPYARAAALSELPTYEQALVMKDGRSAAPPHVVPPPAYAAASAQADNDSGSPQAAAGCSGAAQTAAQSPATITAARAGQSASSAVIAVPPDAADVAPPSYESTYDLTRRQ